MTIKINYLTNRNNKNVTNHVFFVKGFFESLSSSLKSFFSESEIKYANQILKKKNNKKIFLFFDFNEKKKKILINIIKSSFLFLYKLNS